MAIEFMPHQEEGIGFLMNTDASLLHWDMGTGKTYTAAFAAREVMRGGCTVVVCPAVARRNWAREIEAVHGDRVTVNVIEKGSDKLAGDFVVISYELATRQRNKLSQIDIDVLILDESQFLKNIKSKRTAAIFGHQGLARQAGVVWCLSGTPTPNNIMEIYPWLHCMHPEVIETPRGAPMSGIQFRDAFCETVETPFGINIVGTKTGPSQDLWRALQPVVSRVRKEDVLKDLPPVRFQDYPVAGDATVREVRRLEQEHRDAIEQVIEGARGSGQVDMHLTTLRRVTELAKVGDAIAMVRQELEDEAIEKIVIFANYLDTIDALTTGLEEFNPVAVHGSVSANQRQAAIDTFQEGIDCRVFVGQVQAASTAITLHAHGDCQDVLFISADWVPANNAQAVARVHRKGQPNAVTARFLHLENSLDEQVQKTLIRKSHQLSTVFEERNAHHAA